MKSARGKFSQQLPDADCASFNQGFDDMKSYQERPIPAGLPYEEDSHSMAMKVVRFNPPTYSLQDSQSSSQSIEPPQQMVEVVAKHSVHQEEEKKPEQAQAAQIAANKNSNLKLTDANPSFQEEDKQEEALLEAPQQVEQQIREEPLNEFLALEQPARQNA